MIKAIQVGLLLTRYCLYIKGCKKKQYCCKNRQKARSKERQKINLGNLVFWLFFTKYLLKTVIFGSFCINMKILDDYCHIFRSVDLHVMEVKGGHDFHGEILATQ